MAFCLKPYKSVPLFIYLFIYFIGAKHEEVCADGKESADQEQFCEDICFT